MWFASDNSGPAHPAIIESVAAASAGHSASYGAEAGMARVTARVRDIFQAPEAEVYLVATGTAANALGLACLCPPWGTVYCHRHAHVAEDECGAPEFYTGGAKLTLIDGADGKIGADDLAQAIATTVRVGVHNVQPGAVSLTNTTECGTVYSPDEIRALTAVARAHGLPVHLDGARFANALARIGCTQGELTREAGIDVLSLGGSKNGLITGEAVILFDPRRAWEFELRRKRGGHLISRHRFLSAQMEAYFADGLWLSLAAAANARAVGLAEGLAAVPGARLLHPVEANMVFAAWPEAGHRAAEAAGARYYPHRSPPGWEPAGRLVCGWATTEAEVARLLAVLGDAMAGRPV